MSSSGNTELFSNIKIFLTFLFHKESLKLLYQTEVEEKLYCRILKEFILYFIFDAKIFSLALEINIIITLALKFSDKKVKHLLIKRCYVNLMPNNMPSIDNLFYKE